jgi:hypothetical protein
MKEAINQKFMEQCMLAFSNTMNSDTITLPLASLQKNVALIKVEKSTNYQ